MQIILWARLCVCERGCVTLFQNVQNSLLNLHSYNTYGFLWKIAKQEFAVQMWNDSSIYIHFIQQKVIQFNNGIHFRFVLNYNNITEYTNVRMQCHEIVANWSHSNSTEYIYISTSPYISTRFSIGWLGQKYSTARKHVDDKTSKRMFWKLGGLIGVSGVTIRNWSSEYCIHLLVWCVRKVIR